MSNPSASVSLRHGQVGRALPTNLLKLNVVSVQRRIYVEVRSYDFKRYEIELVQKVSMSVESI